MPEYDVGIFPHKCTEPGCKYTVQFDDEPKCFKHSPDSGSSVSGYSAKAAVLEEVKRLQAEGMTNRQIADILHIEPSIVVELNGNWVFATSKNTGPSWGSDPVYLVYLGTDINKAEEAVGDFVRYQREEKDFPRDHPDLYTALPRDMECEMIQWYMADGWWYSIHRFKI